MHVSAPTGQVPCHTTHWPFRQCRPGYWAQSRSVQQTEFPGRQALAGHSISPARQAHVPPWQVLSPLQLPHEPPQPSGPQVPQSQ